ncbi:MULTISPECIES: DUF1971 domain-containing protein [unclassified Rhizobium]|uniref:DUF1971 domain-containing protein n=1 Tax=unclassified Rhizobium TaxID=2613769 RepID=UPI000AC12A69|nr:MULTISPECIES: DUF1971 domain-containing protein [unclassified Rhizobium]
MEAITEAEITLVLERFYEKVRRDPEIGPVFDVVTDWDEHIVRLSEFWSSLMLTSGRYKGNPMSMHMMHSDKIRPGMFNQWLTLWMQTTSELLTQSIAALMQAKASRIASRLSLTVCGSLPPGPVTHISLPRSKPYMVTQDFDESSIPAALLREHSLKPGSWGVVRITEGSVALVAAGREILTSQSFGLILPEIPHHLETLGPVKFRIEFYDHAPTTDQH